MTAEMEKETLQSLNLIGYQGPLLKENDFKEAISEGAKNIEYTKLVNFLANEIRALCNIDEQVNFITAPEDSVSFIMETSSFLTELGCPYVSFMQGHVSDRLNIPHDRILLIQHLIGELQASRMLREKRPEKSIELKLQESSQAADLRKILQTLGFPKPPANITMGGLMQKIIPSVEKAKDKAGKELLSNPIFNGTLSEEQWEMLGNVQLELHEDYSIRREMLLKRLDCTIQSFQWSDKTKGKDDLFKKTYSEGRGALKAEPDVDLSDLLASRDDLAIIEKTSSASVRKNTSSSINKVIIGLVPDRGGRTSEQAPPPPEMPPWQQRSAGPPGGGGFRGGRGGSNYSRGGAQQGQNFSRGGYNRSQDNVVSYGGDSSKNYSRGGNQGGNYSRAGNSGNSYSYGGGNNYSRNEGNSHRGGSDYSSRSEGSNYSRSSNYQPDDYARRNSGSFDSAGSYGNYSRDYQEPKRVKTYDQFQQNRTSSYADQYVQENQHNQQYRARDYREGGTRGGGRSNYNRGEGGGNW